MISPEMIREKRPIVQCLANMVTANDCANILLAAGASATMAHHPAEMKEIQTGCNALVCNFGSTENYEAMLLAAKTASECGHPIVVDPVGCAGSAFRREQFNKLVEVSNISCLRGNYAEIKALRDMQSVSVGVDVGPLGQTDPSTVGKWAMELAKELKCIVIASGKVDIVTDGEYYKEVSAGSEMMSRITGAGCMFSTLLGAYLAVENSVESACDCCERFGKAGEAAAKKTSRAKGGSMTFRNYFIDEFFVG